MGETITITTLRKVVYTVYLHNYGGSSLGEGTDSEGSGATISVYSSRGKMGTVDVPSADSATYKDAPTLPYKGKFREESAYVRMLCIDARGAVPFMRADQMYMKGVP